MDDFRIRKAKAEDVAVIHGLLKALEGSLGASDRVQRRQSDLLQHGFSSTPLFEALIAWQGNKPIGLALFFPEFSSWRGSPGVYVQDLYVDRDARGLGLGRKLMKAVFETASQWGADYCKLAVYDDNEAAVAFYRKLGFHVCSNEHILLLDGIR